MHLTDLFTNGYFDPLFHSGFPLFFWSCNLKLGFQNVSGLSCFGSLQRVLSQLNSSKSFKLVNVADLVKILCVCYFPGVG